MSLMPLNPAGRRTKKGKSEAASFFNTYHTLWPPEKVCLKAECTLLQPPELLAAFFRLQSQIPTPGGSNSQNPG